MTLTRAIQVELVNAAVESDISLVKLVGKEANKAIQYFLNKIEELIIATADAKKLNTSNPMTKNHSQEHNSLILVLLLQFQEVLSKLPETILKSCYTHSLTTIEDVTTATSNTSTLKSSSTSSTLFDSSSISESQLHQVLHRLFQPSDGWLHELIANHLLKLSQEAILTYIKSVLSTLPNELAINPAHSHGVASGAGGLEMVKLTT